MRNYFRAKWAAWRINRWLKLRQKGVSTKRALYRSFLSAEKAFFLLEKSLQLNLSYAGVVFGPGEGWDARLALREGGQIGVILPALADLSEVLPEEEQGKIREMLTELEFHNWGLVRTAATEAFEILEAKSGKHHESTT